MYKLSKMKQRNGREVKAKHCLYVTKVTV